jgi:hypothetical protein
LAGQRAANCEAVLPETDVARVSRPVDPDDTLQELFDLWLAPTADALHRVLVLHQPVRGSADAFEPFALLQKHHKTEPECSLTTAVLMLTDRRWGNGAWRLVCRIADSGILDADQLDLLARTFLAADDAIYWQVSDEWIAGGEAFVIELDDSGPDGEDGDDVPEEGPTVARRQVFPPLRRWAAAHELALEPAAWPALLARAGELNARDAAAVVAGLLDRFDVLAPDALAFLVKQATTWPHHAVRRLALEYIVARDGAEAASLLARDDPNACIRAWAAKLVTPSPVEPPQDDAGAHSDASAADRADQATLF